MRRMKAVLRLTILLALCSMPVAASAGSGIAVTPERSTILPRRDGLDVRHGNLLIRITAINDNVVRVRVAPLGALPEDASWAVSAEVRSKTIAVRPEADGFDTGSLKVKIDPATLAITIADQSGHVVLADTDAPFAFDGKAFTLHKSLPHGEHIFGLGDKTGGTLDRRGKTFVDWNTDAYGFDSSTDPIYKSIPFFIGVGGDGGSYGLLLDNTWRTWFDFGHKVADTLAMGGPDGPIDYYVIAGPSTRDVVRRYTDLTGKAPLPPQWALGYQQSRYSYMSAQEVRQVADTLRADKIPTDAIWLDIDFQDRNRPFTVNTDTYPDLPGLVRDLGAKGIKVVTIADLHIAHAPDQGYAPYDMGIAHHAFVHDHSGAVYVGKVWPGPSVFPDFTDSAARAWWGTNFKAFVADGVAGFWNDMNEPSVFNATGTMPLDAVHHIDSDGFAPRDASHAEVHNVYGMENTRATYDGVKALRPNERPFVMTRAAYAGGQRYAVTWTGDNSSTWDHLKLAVHQLINLGLSGFSYAGADVGGYTGGPSPALMTRWFEIASFTPIFRDHSEKGSPRAEPWLDGPDQLAIRRRFVDERYRLMPYLYALADQNARTGDPLMRPIFYDFPSALGASCDQSMDFTLGRSLLIAPPPEMESPQPYTICLPKGGWYDYWTGRPVDLRTAAPPPPDAPTPADAAVDRIRETPRLDRLPVFVRAGTILPRQPLVASTAQTPVGPLQIDVYPGPDCAGMLYLDDGHSLQFAQGAFLRQAIHCAISADGGLAITFDRREAGYSPWWRSVAFTVHGQGHAGTVQLANKAVSSRYDADARTVAFQLPDTALATAATITLNPGPNSFTNKE